MSTVTNKANIQPIPTERYQISSSEIQTYLQNTLGFSVPCDFTRWTGVAPEYSYVRMRAVLNPKDLVISNDNKTYVDKVIQNMPFDQNVMNILKPFMYPETVGNLMNHPEDLRRMYEYGLYGERLDEVIRYAKIQYAEKMGYFLVYLRPERIIMDMLADPTTDKVDGHFAITGVHGTTSETLRWDVEISHSNGFVADQTGQVSIDAIFNSK